MRMCSKLGTIQSAKIFVGACWEETKFNEHTPWTALGFTVFLNLLYQWLQTKKHSTMPHGFVYANHSILFRRLTPLLLTTVWIPRGWQRWPKMPLTGQCSHCPKMSESSMSFSWPSIFAFILQVFPCVLFFLVDLGTLVLLKGMSVLPLRKRRRRSMLRRPCSCWTVCRLEAVASRSGGENVCFNGSQTDRFKIQKVFGIGEEKHIYNRPCKKAVCFMEIFGKAWLYVNGMPNE